MIRLEDRRQIVEAVDEAHRSGARVAPACEMAGIDIRTLQRWRASDGLERGDGRPLAKRPMPSNALSEAERRKLLEVANEPRFAEVPASAHRAGACRRRRVLGERVELLSSACASTGNAAIVVEPKHRRRRGRRRRT